MANWASSTRSRSLIGLWCRLIIVLAAVFTLYHAGSFYLNYDIETEVVTSAERTYNSLDTHAPLKYVQGAAELSSQTPSKPPSVDQVATTPADYRAELDPVMSSDDMDRDKPDTKVDAEFDNAVQHRKYPTAEPVAQGPSKAIVVSSTSKERTAWWHEYFSDWDLNIYVVDDQNAKLTLLVNQGRESAVYLTYIIDHYDQLPDYIVFSHAQRYQWHTDDPLYDSVNPIKMLQLPYVREQGYVSLRCAWYQGCPVALRPNLTAPSDFFDITKDYAKAFQHFFPDTEIPSVVGAPCCAQFALTREHIRKRPVDDYKRFREWLWNTRVAGGKSGRIFEYLWHYIFHQPIQNCKPTKQCYCKTFGLCNLKCPDKSHCLGRYAPPPIGKHMPIGWPHPKKQNGFVKDKWWEKFYPPEKWDGFEPRKKPESKLKAKPKSKADSKKLTPMPKSKADSKKLTPKPNSNTKWIPRPQLERGQMA